MTCVVGLKHEGTIYIGADSAGVSDWDMGIRADRKVFRNGSYLFGFSGSFRMGQLLEHALKIPPREDEPAFGFMCTGFVDAVRECLKAGGYARKEHDQETMGMFLLGTTWGSLYRIESDYQVCEFANAYDAIGCGHAYALGALALGEMDQQHLNPLDRVNAALSVAHQHSAGVRPPFHVEKL